MQYADPATDWDDWDDTHGDADETARLAALREYIFATAEEWVGRESITAGWLNKKLAKLGITDRIQRENSYTLRSQVTAEVDLVVYARSRAEALEKTALRLDGTNAANVRNVTAVGAPAFTSGPEDPTPDVADDAPQTVEDTLVKLREVIMLAVIAGPKVCENGANRVLAQYGLTPIPQRQSFTVRQPVVAMMETKVEAYDLDSAARVAGWRWENDRNGYAVQAATTSAPMTVAAD